MYGPSTDMVTREHAGALSWERRHWRARDSIRASSLALTTLQNSWASQRTLMRGPRRASVCTAGSWDRRRLAMSSASQKAVYPRHHKTQFRQGPRQYREGTPTDLRLIGRYRQGTDFKSIQYFLIYFISIQEQFHPGIAISFAAPPGRNLRFNHWCTLSARVAVWYAPMRSERAAAHPTADLRFRRGLSTILCRFRGGLSFAVGNCARTFVCGDAFCHYIGPWGTRGSRSTHLRTT